MVCCSSLLSDTNLPRLIWSRLSSVTAGAAVESGPWICHRSKREDLLAPLEEEGNRGSENGSARALVSGDVPWLRGDGRSERSIGSEEVGRRRRGKRSCC
uniref:Uncharacterized protein n=1 Tax=Populus davidiana TaxID=266767 RepID=A0A6M2ELQ3_9ROSI